jgi:hypothetical protein
MWCYAVLCGVMWSFKPLKKGDAGFEFDEQVLA